HLTCPILRVHPKQKHIIALQLQRAIMQLGVRVVVILKALALQPAQQPPLAGRKAALRSSLDRIANRRAIPRRVVEDMVAMLRTLKSKRAIRFVGQAPDALGLVISAEVLPRIDR